MLERHHISEQYGTGETARWALQDVSLFFLDSESAAILGPSGSGKTALLNIIGGPDRCSKGDPVINGISTEKFTARDWGTYRNRTIGFVFQSCSRISHQTVLSNAEPALTLSGISGRERTVKALQQMGLGDQPSKHPNQLSGGQMQRIAIARVLVRGLPCGDHAHRFLLQVPRHHDAAPPAGELPDLPKVRAEDPGGDDARGAALGLLLSASLTLLAGIIPLGRAAKSGPLAAFRSE